MWFLELLAAAWLVLHLRTSWRRSGLGWWDFVILKGARLYARLWHRWTSNGLAPLPAQGSALVIANHTCSADPTFLLAGCRRPLSFLVAGEHYHVHPLIRRLLDHLGCVAVKRSGQDALGLRQALGRLQQGGVLCLFPEGNLSGVAQRRPRRPKLGVALLALRCRLPVFPAHIAGGPCTDNLLASWLWPSKVPVHVHFGPPIDLSAYYDRPRTKRLYEEVADLLMGRVQELGDDQQEKGQNETSYTPGAACPPASC